MSALYDNLRMPGVRWASVSYKTIKIWVSDTGIVMNERGRVYSKELNYKGYPTVKITKMIHGEKCVHRFFVHRLVAEAFIPNPQNLPQVNHIDGNKLNSHYTNLEWCDQSYNIRHAYRTFLKKPPEEWLKRKRYGKFLKLLPVGDYQLKTPLSLGLKVSVTILTQNTNRKYSIVYNGGEFPIIRVCNKA